MSLFGEFQHWRNRVVRVVRGGRTLLLCPTRRREFVDGPEEEIRQGLLHFLIDLNQQVGFDLRAESERHDIDLLWSPTPNFSPGLAPLLIVETKVDEAAGEWTNPQLVRYLAETRGDCGVVFTGRRMWSVVLTGTRSKSTPLFSLADLAALVRQRAAVDPHSSERDDFIAARDGNREALLRLVAKYPFATFVLSIDGVELPCRMPRFNSDGITYRISHTKKPLAKRTQQRERLVRIE